MQRDTPTGDNKMTNAETTLKFLSATTRKTVNMILDNIAGHYGCTRAEAFNEVTHDEAESLLDYVTGPERAATHVLMKIYKAA